MSPNCNVRLIIKTNIIMKRVFIVLTLLTGFLVNADAQSASSMKWSDICSGKMPAEWYGSDEAQQIADVVLSVQKNNGGWMKNDQLHNLTASQLKTLQNARGEHSCLDNTATTQEMRFPGQGLAENRHREIQGVVYEGPKHDLQG